MARKDENNGFACKNCSKAVSPIIRGSIRNHCPSCLYSLHVDITPGDRLATCGGLMSPIGARQHSKKGWQIEHKCAVCGFVRVNIVADDDDFDKICKLAANRIGDFVV